MLKRIFYILSLFYLPLVVTGQSLEAALDSTNILVGDQVHFSLKAKVPNGYAFQLPVFRDTLVSGVEILEIKGPDTTFQSDTHTEITLNLLITAFDSAFFIIPPQALAYMAKGDTAWQFVWSDANLLSVFTMPVDMSQPYFDIKTTFLFPITWKEALFYSVIGMLVALLILTSFYVYKRWRRGEKILPSFRRPVPPHELALRDLEVLRTSRLWEKGEVKEYYVSLSFILRRYVEGRFSLPALESTSDEIRELFQTNSIIAGKNLQMDEFLDRSDLVKFAKAQPLAEEHAQSFETVKSFVLATMPQQSEPSERRQA